MSAADRPVLVAFDGSDESQAALRAAADLLPSRLLVVVTVWEPQLAEAMVPLSDNLSGLSYVPPDPQTLAMVEDAQHEHADSTAAAGAQMARELGVTAEPHAVPDEVNIVETIAAVAERRDAAAIVVGSRGLGRVKSSLLGSTSKGLLRHTSRPVIVVRT